VKTPSGYRNIEDIRAGDKVLSYNETTKRLQVQTVAQTFIRKTDRIYTLVYDTGTKLQTTATHPFYIEGKGWVKAADLHLGDDSLLSREVSQLDVYGGARLQNVSYRQSKQGVIVSITVEDRAETVYNFEVNETHTYLVGDADVVVHNAQGYAAEAPVDPMQNADGTYNIDKINERYDGITGGFRVFGEALWNGLSLRGFQRDYLVTNTSSGFISGISDSERDYAMKQLNSATTSISFQQGADGQLVMVERGDLREERPTAAKLMNRLFGDENHSITFLGDKDAPGVFLTDDGSRHYTSDKAFASLTPDARRRLGMTYKNSRDAAGGPTHSYVVFDPAADAQEFSVYRDSQTGELYQQRLNGPNRVFTALHELVHSDRYRQEQDSILEKSKYRATDAVHIFSDGRRGIPDIPLEEHITVGNTSFWSQVTSWFRGDIDENDLRREANADERLQWTNPAAPREPNYIKQWLEPLPGPLPTRPTGESK